MSSKPKSGKSLSRKSGAIALHPSKTGTATNRTKKALARVASAARAARLETQMEARADARPSKAQQVYFELRRQILCGELEPGAAIDKLAVCAKLGVSRFPVQAAINRLAFERFVDIQPQHGSFVAPMSHAAIREYQMIRRSLECEIAEMAASRLTPEDHAALADNLALQGAAALSDNGPAFYELDVAFHQLIARPLALAYAVDALEAARTHLERVRRMLLAPRGRLSLAYAEHLAIAEALATGEGSRARQAMRSHLNTSATAIELVFSDRPELFAA